MSNNALSGTMEIALQVSAKKYCSHHGSEVPFQEGSFVLRNKTKRWICNNCQAKSAKRKSEIEASTKFS